MRGTVVRVNRSGGGIPKLSVSECRVTQRGLEGDSWLHTRYHGGPLQALLLITIDSFRELNALGFAVYPGALGENLTVEGLDRTLWRTGQRFRAGTVLLELTKLRQPCRTLDRYGRGIQKLLLDTTAKKGDPSSLVWARGGFYASVLEPGTVHEGDTIELAG